MQINHVSIMREAGLADQPDAKQGASGALSLHLPL